MKPVNLSWVKLLVLLLFCAACVAICVCLASTQTGDSPWWHDQERYNRCDFPRTSDAQAADKSYVPFCIATYRRALALPSLTTDQHRKLSELYHPFYIQLQTLGQKFIALRQAQGINPQRLQQIDKLQNQMVAVRIVAWRTVKYVLTPQQLSQLREMAFDADFLGPIVERKLKHGHAVMAVGKNNVLHITCVHMPDNSRLLEVQP